MLPSAAVPTPASPLVLFPKLVLRVDSRPSFSSLIPFVVKGNWETSPWQKSSERLLALIIGSLNLMFL